MTHLLMPTKVLFILGVSPGSPAKHPSDLAKQGLRRLLKWCHSCDSRSSEFAKGRGLKQKWRNVAVAPRTAKQPLLHLIIEVTQCWLFAVFQRNCKRFVECYSVDRTRDVYDCYLQARLQTTWVWATEPATSISKCDIRLFTPHISIPNRPQTSIVYII